ncbi:DNA repair protein XRCC2-like, partial [Copidosoma floridanum]|uniref:DNA repair protein XRCC2-like n=1 Tax=Copidosoma floridanum TaxID=29053 RepID=UPI0006C9B028
MSAEPIVESGLQLITRLIDRPSVQDLDSDLFFKGLDNNDVVEIRGTIGSGVDELLNKLITKCILPLKYNGLNMEVLLLNTENQFQISRLYRNLHNEITNVQGPIKVDEIVLGLLNNLKITSCYNHQQLLLTLSSLENILLTNKKVGMIVLDSISAYYWQKKDESYNTYLMKFLRIIRKVTIDFKVVVLYTKQFDFASKKHTLEWHEGKKLLRYEISLCINEHLNQLVCNIKSGEDKKQLSYELNNLVFTWLEVRIVKAFHK